MLQYFNILLSSIVDLLVMSCHNVTIILSFYVRLDVALKLGRSKAYFCNFRLPSPPPPPPPPPPLHPLPPPPPPLRTTLNKSHIAHIAHPRNSSSREKL